MEHPVPPVIQTLWYDELQTIRREMLREAAGLTQAQADWRPAPEEWSVGQNLEHIRIDELDMNKATTKLLKIAMGVEKFDQAIFEMSAREGKLGVFPTHFTKLDDFGELPPPPPPGFKTESAEPEHGLPIAQLIVDLNVLREKSTKVSIERISLCDPRGLTRVHLAHKGREINIVQWWRIQARHDTAHVRQIRKLKSLSGFPVR